jgi:hypothetical protein
MKKKQDKIIFQEENKLNKPNILINIVNQKSLSLKAKKIYNIFLRQLLNQNEEEYNKNCITTTITALTKELGIKNRTEISDLLYELKKQDVIFDHMKEDGVYEIHTSLLSEIHLKKQGRDTVSIHFSPLLANEIKKYNDRYTKLDLIECGRLKVSHSLTMYELFKSKICGFKFQFQNYTEKELREKLGLIDSYEDIRYFNNSVIKKSIQDINENMSIQIQLLKIERPNTKNNPTDERIYKFKIAQELSKIIGFSLFIDFIRSRNTPIEYRNGSNTYSLESEGLMSGSGKKYWLRAISGEKTTKKIADSIWKEMYKKFSIDSETFLMTLNISPNDLIEWTSKN